MYYILIVLVLYSLDAISVYNIQLIIYIVCYINIYMQIMYIQRYT